MSRKLNPSAEVLKEYNVSDQCPGAWISQHHGHREFNLSTLTLEDAELLSKDESFGHITKKSKDDKAAAKADGKK